jgi:hypothetical protein
VRHVVKFSDNASENNSSQQVIVLVKEWGIHFL